MTGEAAQPLQSQHPHSGADLFRRRFTVDNGLGPEFNAPSCATCHDFPVAGGTSRQSVDWMYDGPGDRLGRPAQRFAVDARGVVVEMRGGSSHKRRPPSLFGLGLLESVPTEVIRARVDASDADGDGISARLPMRDECAGRFGWQSTTCDLPDFIRSALQHELGIVTLPKSRREITERQFDDLVAFVRALPAPTPAASDDGHDLFIQVGCAGCHAPTIGTIDIAGASQTVRAYTDLLLHEMGTGPRHRDADSRTEFRTAPLWGIGVAGPYMHDGSARTLEEAVRRHAGEATRARERFTSLSAPDRERLVRFVATR